MCKMDSLCWFPSWKNDFFSSNIWMQKLNHSGLVGGLYCMIQFGKQGPVFCCPHKNLQPGERTNFGILG
jgi:hypothetical protein